MTLCYEHHQDRCHNIQDVVLSEILDQILARNYMVFIFRSIRSAIDYIYNSPPNLILLDASEKDSYSMKLLNSLKSDPYFYQLPILLVVDNSVNVPASDIFFVDDYLKRSDLVTEEMTRVSLAILRSERIVDVNPLTKLPRQHIHKPERSGPHRSRRRLRPCLCGTLDHFKPFNDHYGFSRGDRDNPDNRQAYSLI